MIFVVPQYTYCETKIPMSLGSVIPQECPACGRDTKWSIKEIHGLANSIEEWEQVDYGVIS